MGPTLNAQPSLPSQQPTCDCSTVFPDFSSSEMEFEVKKIEVPPEIGTNHENETFMKVIVSEVQKLSKSNQVCQNVARYKRIWFEGPLSEKYNAISGLTPIFTGTSTSTSSFLCVEMEKYEFVTLTKWLEDRQDDLLSESQILHIVFQLASAVNFLIETGVTPKKELSLSDIQVIQENSELSQYAPNLFPNVKLSAFQFEALLHSLSTTAQAPPVIKNDTIIKSESLLHFLARVFTGLLLRNTAHLKSQGTTEYPPEEWKLIEEMGTHDTNPFNCKSVVTKLHQLRSKFKHGLTFNIAQPSKRFVGRETELKSLLTIVTEFKSKLIVIHGAPGMGKSELITQLSWKMLDRQQENGQVETNVVSFDASSSDSLTSSVYKCASQIKPSIPTRDYLGNPRLLKDIFLEMVSSFGENDLLLIFDNSDQLSVDTLDLIQMFKENALSISNTSARHHLILITREIWTSCPLIEDSNCTTLSLSPINLEASRAILKQGFLGKTVSASLEILPTIVTDESLDKLSETLQCYPAALKIISDYAKTPTGLSCEQVLEALENFKSQFTEIHHIEQSLQPVCLSYSFALFQLLETLDAEKKTLLSKLLKFLQFIDGDTGIFVDTLLELFSQSHISPEGVPLNMLDTVSSVLSTLRCMSLVRVTDGVVRLPHWMQFCMKMAVQMIIKKDSCDTNTLLSAYFISLSSKSVESDCWKIIGHAAKIWKIVAKKDPEIAKRFDALPELIAKLAKSFKKLELVAGFLKEAIDIFSTAYKNSYDIHVIKLKFLLTTECLIAKGKLNEAFIVLKGIQENCTLEPRDCLMIKLKALIELGKIHVSRQQYEKAIACFQHVQVFSVQKISILQLDSEPTVLHSRLLHGQAYLKQGNLDEAKKIILGVIPLLEKFSGPDEDNIKLLVLQAKFHLAVLLRKAGDLVNALMMQTKVLEERERIFGNKHPDTWTSKQEMSMLFSAYDNHEKALLLLRQLLEVQEEVLGAPSNTHSLSTMNAIAEIEARLGNFEDALELYEAIDLIEQQVLPENDEMRISSQLSQAEVLMSLGQYKEATDIFDLVYTLRSTSDDKSSYNLKLCESILSKREKAERSMEVLGNYWLSLTPENVDDPSELSALAKKHEVAMQLAENQDNHGALRFLREVLEDCAHLEETNRFHLNVKADFARVLGLVGKFNESFSVYKEIIPLMDATFGETDELTMLCKDTMGQVFLFSGNQFLKRQMSNLKWFLL